MADPITLGAAQSLAILQKSRIARVREAAAQALSTGRGVSGIADNPRDYLQAKALTERVAGLLNAKSNIGQGIAALGAAGNGIEAATRLGEQLKGIALAAESADEAGRATLSRQFDTVREQLNLLVKDVSYRGTNLLDDPADTLRVGISDRPGVRLDVEGKASNAASLGIGAAADYGDLATLADIDGALAAVDAALSTLKSNAAEMIGNTAILQVREQFSQDLAATHQTGADKLVAADLNAEAAKMMASGVRDTLATEGMRIAARSDALVAQMLA